MNRFEKWSVLATSLATLLTGAGYFWTKYLVEPAEPWAVVNHPLQVWFLKAHILVAPLLVFAVGSIAVRHVWRHFRSGMPAGRRSGLGTALSLAPMVLSGYLIQSITAEGWLKGVAIAHIAVSVLYSLGLGAHYYLMRSRPGAVPRHRAHRRVPPRRQHPAHRL